MIQSAEIGEHSPEAGVACFSEKLNLAGLATPNPQCFDCFAFSVR
jgi:hypothetical protein